MVNAHASTLGDNGGIDLGWHDGVLLIGEVGATKGALRASVGAWHYSKDPEDLYEMDASGQPLRKSSQGAYIIVEGDLLSGGERQLTAFLRAGLSDPHATPFKGGLQTGLLLAPAIAGRSDSALSVGVHHAWTSHHFRDALAASGGRPSGGESVVELTYSDKLLDFVSLQPDVQWIHRPGADVSVKDAVVVTLRTTLSF